jgi:hypothetical protein
MPLKGKAKREYNEAYKALLRSKKRWELEMAKFNYHLAKQRAGIDHYADAKDCNQSYRCGWAFRPDQLATVGTIGRIKQICGDRYEVTELVHDRAGKILKYSASSRPPYPHPCG